MPINSTAWLVWSVASIFYAYQYILRVMPSVMLSDIIHHFHIDTVLFGQFSGIYYLGYSFMHIPVGIMLDRFGPRKVMTGCILITVIGLLPIIVTDHWIYPIIGRALIGIGSSAAILGTFKIIRLTFQEQRFTRMLSLSVTIGLLGAIYGGGPLNYLYHWLGYKIVIEIFSCFGVLLAIITYCIVPNTTTTSTTSIFSDIKEVFTNRRVILLCLFAGFMVGPLEGFADIWGLGFFKHVYGFDSNIASSLPSIIFVGMCFGAPILNFIAEKTRNFLAVIAFSGFAMVCIFIILLLLLTHTISVIATLCVIIGICSAYQILAIYEASTYVSDHIVGLTTAVANMIIMSFGYAFHTLIGLIIHTCDSTNLATAYLCGITVIPIMVGIGMVGFFLMLYKRK
jgi:predicted MFS family arabinose efflux permease